MWRLAAGALLLWLGGALATATDEPDALALGRRQVADGEFEAAVVTLDNLARDLVAASAPGPQLARVHLFLGAAYVGLGQDALARRKFQRALELDPTVVMSEEEFPRKVRRAFEAAQRSATEKTAQEREVRSKRERRALIPLLLGGAAAGGVAAVVTARERPNTAPTAALTIDLEGVALQGVTTVSFGATASDAEGDALTYRWEFGDGASSPGTTPSHIYEREGTFTAALTVSDGLSSTVATGTVRVRNLFGFWSASGETFATIRGFLFRNDEPGNTRRLRVIIGDVVPREEGNSDFIGLATDPRGVRWGYGTGCLTGVGCECRFQFTGEADSALQTITGTLVCADGIRTCPCRGRSGQMVLTRQ